MLSISMIPSKRERILVDDIKISKKDEPYNPFAEVAKEMKAKGLL